MEASQHYDVQYEKQMYFTNIISGTQKIIVAIIKNVWYDHFKSAPT